MEEDFNRKEFITEVLKSEDVKKYKVKVFLNVFILAIVTILLYVVTISYIYINYYKLEILKQFIIVTSIVLGFTLVFVIIYEIKLSQMYKNIIINTFLEDFKIKLKEEDMENEDVIKEDFDCVLGFNSCAKTDTIYHGPENNINFLKKYKHIDRDFYVSPEYTSTYDYTGRRTPNYFSFYLFTKVNINQRFYAEFMYNTKKSDFDNMLKETEKNILKYDSKYFDYFESYASDEFYFKNFKHNKNEKFLNLDDESKQKLLDLYNKYKIDFSISIMDKCMALHIEKLCIGLKNNIGYVYDVQKMMSEILKIFFNIEKVNKNEE